MGKADENGEAYGPTPIGRRLMRMLTVAFWARIGVLLEGATGIGKSAIYKQLAEELGIEVRVVNLSLLEPPDLVGLPIIKDDETIYARPRILPTEGRGILVLEELNRAELYIQNPALELLTTGRVHEHQIPPGWIVCAAINPAGGDYHVKPLDPAMSDRFLYLKVCADRLEWTFWAHSVGIHPAVLRVARGHDRFLAEVSPRRWAKTSELLGALSPEDLADPTFLRPLLHGFLPPAWVEILIEVLQTQREAAEIDVEGLLSAYHNDRALRDAVKAFRGNGRTDGLDEITHRVTGLVQGPRLADLIADRRFSLQALERLLADLAGDQSEQVQEALGRNPAACDRIELKPADVLQDYRGSKAAKKVDSWIDNPVKHYRVGLLVTALSKHIQQHEDLEGLRDCRHTVFNLGYFLWQIGPKWAAPLAETLQRHGIEPILPDRPKRKPR